MIFSELNADNFMLFAIKYYENPTSSTYEEFEEDLKRFKYVKRWLKKYHETGVINGHLLINHLMIIFNCWEQAAVPMLFYKINSKYWTYLKSLLILINRLPEYPHTNIHDLPTDLEILKYFDEVH